MNPKMALQLQWLTAPEHEPLDRDGPVEVPFEPFESAWISRPICERFDQIAARFSEKMAVDDGDQCFTYGEIQQTSRALARDIEARVPPGAPVGVLLEHPAFFLIAALACLRVGRPIVPIDPHHPAERNALIGCEAGLAAIISDGSGGEANALFKDVPWLDVVNMPGVLPDRALEAAPADAAAFILYTSGSTGRPKGICNSQSAILHRVAQFTNACHLNADDRFLLLSSTGTIAGIRDVFATVLNGAALIIAEPSQVGFEGILRTMDRGRITICYAVPALLRSLLPLREAASAFRHLRILRLGGDVVRESDIALCRSTIPSGCHIQIGYGSTEAPTLFQWFVPRGWSGDGSLAPCGRLLPDVSVALVDETGTAPAAGEVGELIVRSRYLALGHWQDGCLKRDILENDNSLSFLRLGDLLRFRDDGLAELVGRTSRMVKIRGQRVDPGEIEAAVRASKEVAEAVVVVRTEDNAPSLDVFVVPRDLTNPPHIKDLRTTMGQRLPAHMRPNRIHIIAAIPLLAGFKPDLATLTNWNSTEISRQVPDRGPQVSLSGDDRVSKAVEMAWSKLLDQTSFARDDAWSETGGDSLKAMELIFLIEEALHLSVPLDILEQSTTPKALIGALDELLLDASLQGNGSQHAAAQLPLVFLMPGLGGDDPGLARLRADLRTRIRFVTIKYPTSSQMFHAEARFEAIIDVIVAQICLATKSDEIIHLAGYSFGGFVAWEVARRLLAAGYRVGAIGLIDPRRQRSIADLERQLKMPSPMKFAMQIFLRQPRRSVGIISYLAKRWIFSRVPVEVLRLLHSLKMRFPWIKLLRNYDRELQRRALDNFTLSKFDHPATLFRSTYYIKEFPDNGWSDVCPQLTIVPIDGTHESMLASPLRAILAERLFETVAAAEAAEATLHPLHGPGVLEPAA